MISKKMCLTVVGYLLASSGAMSSASAGTVECASDKGNLKISSLSKDHAILSVVTQKNDVHEALLTDFLVSQARTDFYENGIANQNVANTGFTTPYGNWRLLPEVNVRLIKSSDSLASKDLKNITVHLNIQSVKGENLVMEFKGCSESK